MKHINDRSPGFYDPEHRSPKTNGIIVAIFCVLFGGAFGSVSLTLSTGNKNRTVNRAGKPPAKS